MLQPWQKEVNLVWLNKLKDTLKEGGVWVWKDTGYMYTLENGELIGDNEEANEALKAILPPVN